MYSIAFPNMFASNGVKTNLIEDHEATYSNLKLALASTKTSLLGDPDFGSMLKYKLFEQNNIILQDLVIDDIYTTITTFLPQISLERKDITLTQDGVDIYAHIKCINLINYDINTYSINLTTENTQ